MAKPGGLGRGLSSLIPRKNKTNNKAKTKQNTAGASKAFAGTGAVGEVNYFGADSFQKTDNQKKITATNKTSPAKSAQKEKQTKTNLSGSAKIRLKSIMEVGVEEIFPNPYQPRQNFDKAKLQELADSIALHGIIQPLVVTHRSQGGFELIAGERRLEAAKLAGLKTVPVVTKEASEENKAEWALIENIQRHNLNPVEEAEAYQVMKEKFGLTQEEIAQKVGKSRSAVANTLRLLKLPTKIKQALAEGVISEGHARTILALSDEKKQMDLFRSILKNDLNVREVEGVAKNVKLKKTFRIQKNVDPDLLNIENELSELFKTKVKIRGIKENGKIIIDYYSPEELGNIVGKLKGE